MEASQPPQVVALVRDLMFSTRIRSTGESIGVAVKLVRSPQQLGDIPGKMLLVDLNLEGAIPAAADWSRGGQREVVGFVSHVDTETIQAARAAGITQVLARGRFVDVLPELLSRPDDQTRTAQDPP